jgi:chromosome segregation and condensation protein ScpB
MSHLPSKVYLACYLRHSAVFFDKDEALDYIEEMQEEYPDRKYHLFVTEATWQGALDSQLGLW